MSLTFYLKGVAALILVVAPWAWAGRVALRALAPSWPASLRALGAATVATAGVIASAEVVGTAGVFRRLPLALVCIAGAGVVMLAATRIGKRVAPDTPVVAATPVRWATLSLAGRLALVAGCLLFAQWSLSAKTAFDHGITDIDSQSYHLPHAARFVEEESTTGLHYASADTAIAYHPANAELLHAVGMVTMRSDVLSVVLNLASLPLCLLAAFCVGRRFGAGPASVIGFSILAASPYLGEKYAGSGGNDYIAIAFFLAAVAFVLRADEAANEDANAPNGVAFALAGLAAGLSLGTKLTTAVAVAGLTLTVFWLMRRRPVNLAIYSGAAVVGGAYWYVRNLVHVGNPVPTMDLGPLPAPPMELVERQAGTALDYIGESGFLTDIVPHDLLRFFGRAWPLLFVAVAYALVALLVALRKKEAPSRALMIGLVLTTVAALAAYLVTPTTGGTSHNGRPVLFFYNIRYALPGLIAALVLLPAVPNLKRRHSAVAAGGLLLLLVALASPPRLQTRGVVLALLLLGALVVAMQLPKAVLASVAALAVIGGVIVGLPLTREYERGRFAKVSDSPRGELLSFARAARPGARIALVGLPVQYAFNGPRFQTRVDYLGDLRDDNEFTDYKTCASWRAALREGDYDFVVAEPIPAGAKIPKAARWTSSLPGSRIIFDNAAAQVIDLGQVTDWPSC